MISQYRLFARIVVPQRGIAKSDHAANHSVSAFPARENVQIINPFMESL